MNLRAEKETRDNGVITACGFIKQQSGWQPRGWASGGGGVGAHPRLLTFLPLCLFLPVCHLWLRVFGRITPLLEAKLLSRRLIAGERNSPFVNDDIWKSKRRAPGVAESQETSLNFGRLLHSSSSPPLGTFMSVPSPSSGRGGQSGPGPPGTRRSGFVATTRQVEVRRRNTAPPPPNKRKTPSGRCVLRL